MYKIDERVRFCICYFNKLRFTDISFILSFWD